MTHCGQSSELSGFLARTAALVASGILTYEETIETWGEHDRATHTTTTDSAA